MFLFVMRSIEDCPRLLEALQRTSHGQSFMISAPLACMSMCGPGVLADVKLRSEAGFPDVKTSVQTVAVQVPEA